MRNERMKSGDWCVTKDNESWGNGPCYPSKEEAIREGPVWLGLKPGTPFYVGQLAAAGGGLDASDVVGLLDDIGRGDGRPDDGDGFVEGDELVGAAEALGEEAVQELQVLLDAWAKKHDVRPRWFTIENEERHVVPAA